MLLEVCMKAFSSIVSVLFLTFCIIKMNLHCVLLQHSKNTSATEDDFENRLDTRANAVEMNSLN